MIKMKAKYIRFYQNFHKAFQDKKSNHCSNLISNGGMSLNRELVTFLGFLIFPQPYRQNPFYHLMPL